MAFNIGNDEADRLARALGPSLGERLRRLSDEVAHLPVVDARPPEAILAYDEDGLPA